MAMAMGMELKLQVVGFEKKSATASLASFESLTMPLVQQVVLSVDVGCVECRKRVAEVMSRMGEVESVTVNVLEKTVTLSCKYTNYNGSAKSDARRRPQLAAAIYRSNPFNKMALIKRFFRTS